MTIHVIASNRKSISWDVPGLPSVGYITMQESLDLTQCPSIPWAQGDRTDTLGRLCTDKLMDVSINQMGTRMGGTYRKTHTLPVNTLCQKKKKKKKKRSLLLTATDTTITANYNLQ